jgi:hypothetical protein
MQVVAIDTVSDFCSRLDRVDGFHAEMFHGTDDHSYDDLPRSLGDPPKRGLSLSRSGHWVPSIFAPSNIVMVTEGVRGKLRGLPNVEFRAVRYGRLFDFPRPPPGDFSYLRHQAYVRTLDRRGRSHLLERLPDEPALHGRLPPCYELVAARLADVAPRYRGLKAVTFRLPDTDAGKVKAKLSPALLADYPILYWGATLFRGDVFARIDADVDRDFFAVAEVEL